ncbi:MAG: polyprenyl synthetase family protein [Alloprevotella sp.]|nr:polyprenyl synthetase family protein [Alloprevotella sp.]MBR1594939.1 polyprenyl synthetase family protein [Alloprevotella sp.]
MQDYISIMPADIRRPIEEELERYSRMFQETLTHEDDLLGQALEHIRGRKGKMMRPMLVLLVSKACGGVTETSLRAAVALEILHTASLVHDDVVDNSAQRRGAPAEHTLFGNKVAILVGDYLLSQCLHQAALTGDLRIVDIIARLGGTLSEGEIRQLANIRAREVDENTYFHIIHHKTAALFEACARLGALAATATQQQIADAARLGEIIGICFQIRDDIFDYYPDATIGKPTAGDMAEGKLTLPAIHALSQVPPAHPAHTWAERVKALEATSEDIRQLTEFTKQNGGIDYAHNAMESLRSEALPLITNMTSDEDVRNALTLYLDYTIRRTS